MNTYFHKATKLFRLFRMNAHKIVLCTGVFFGLLFPLYLINPPTTEGHTLVYVRILALEGEDASSPTGTDQIYFTVNGDSASGVVWGPFSVTPPVVFDFFGSLAVPFHNNCTIRLWHARPGPDFFLGSCVIPRSLVGAGARTCHFNLRGRIIT